MFNKTFTDIGNCIIMTSNDKSKRDESINAGAIEFIEKDRLILNFESIFTHFSSIPCKIKIMQRLGDF